MAVVAHETVYVCVYLSPTQGNLIRKPDTNSK